jgi:hypothetical protein
VIHAPKRSLGIIRKEWRNLQSRNGAEPQWEAYCI